MNVDDIIKALKCCSRGGCTADECPYYGVENCSGQNSEDAIALITRQIAEIEKLIAEIETLRDEIDDLLKKVPEGERT